ncbi:MAG TPA: MEDS domain-containing protein [Thermoanaerobaculia bacterium]|nr:MEDS domain-containing protein [Thermoanaerobaculia bacterium]
MTALRLLIADDHAAMRRSIRTLLESRAGWTVCGEAADGEDAVEQTSRLRPDVALLDYEMPKLNGLEAARRIHECAPAVQVLILTIHDFEGLHDEARRAGAGGVVVKSDAGDSLLRTIETLAIRLAGAFLRGRRHIAAFFHSPRERYRVLAPFIADGIARGEKAVHLIDPPDRDSHVRRLQEAGVDVAAAETRHQLELLSWDETYLRDGRFDQAAMAAMVDEILGTAAADGYPRTRGVAYMEWALGDQPGVKDLVVYEARLNDVLAEHGDVVICAYDLMKFPGHLILDVLRAHPAVIVGGALRENPFYTPPAAMIAELRERGIRGH